MKAGRLVLAALLLAGCAAPAPPLRDSELPQGAVPLHDAALLHDPAVGRCAPTGRVTGRFVYREQDLIQTYCEAANLAAYRGALPTPFTMPQRPLVRVSVLDFYEMASGPAYLESTVSLLVLHQGQPGWFVLTMPVTDGDACSGGRAAWGYPKIVRRVTLERGSARYVGTSYAVGGRTPALRLTLDVGEPGAAARELLRYVYPFPSLTLKAGSVLRFGGGSSPAYDLERVSPEAWKVRLGRARLEYPQESESLLHRLGVGQPLAAYWAQLRARYSIAPR